ncbi:hypothetical protein JCM3774_006121 [Rhodotorula dairenensis]
MERAALPTPEHERPDPPLAHPAALVAAPNADRAMHAPPAPAAAAAAVAFKDKQEPPQAVKAEDHYPSPPHAGTSPAANKPTISIDGVDIPLPSFVDPAALSSSSDEDSDSSSDEDENGDPKPPRPVKTSKSTGLPKPRPAYYYDESYDAGTAGPKKRHGRRGGFKGVPVFEPTMEDFEGNGGFYGFVKRIEKYGMRSGIVKVIPPKEWSDSLPSVADPLRSIRLRDAIEQHMVGSQGLYRVMNEAKSRVWNPYQWQQRAVRPQSDAPDVLADEKRGDRSERTTVSTTKRKRAASAASAGGTKAAGKRRASEAGQGAGGGDEATDADADADTEDVDEVKALPKGRRTPARKAKVEPTPEPVAGGGAAAATPPKKKRGGSSSLRSEPTDEEWADFTASLYDLPHGMNKSDYTVERMRDFERRYWRTLTFGEPPMYGADMAGSLFNDETRAWNVAHLGDLLPKLAPTNCEIPGVVSPYLYFGMWRATFAWHVEDADLYSINYIHFGAPKFWYSVPQEQAERFERVMEGLFPTDRSKCSQFLRHKAFLASPRILSNHGITLNRCAQLPGEFILTYPKGYHSGFNLGFNCAESINFATERWLPLGQVAKHCNCIEDSVSIDVNIWLRQAAKEEALARGEPWPYDQLDEQAALALEEEAERQRQAKLDVKKRAAEAASLSTSAPPRKKAKPTPTNYPPYLTPLQRQHLILTPAMPGVHASSIVTMTLYEAIQSPDILDVVKQQLTQLLQHPSGQWGVHSQIRLQAIPNPLPRPAYLDMPPPVAPSNPYSNAAFHYYPSGPGAAAAPSASSSTVGHARSATPQGPPPAPPQPEWPCALCPDMSRDGLVRIGEPGQKSKKRLEAHRICVTFTPATWIEPDPQTGEELVRGYAKIEKARWKLKCQLCTEMHGTKVQCTKGKCAKSFHVTCALQEGSGIFLDATIPDAEHDGESVSIFEQAKSPQATGPSSPGKAALPDAAATSAPTVATVTTEAGTDSAAKPDESDATPAAPAPTPTEASNSFVHLTILCRTHNPDWQRQEAERRTNELLAKVDALQPGERIRVKTTNGNYDVSFDRVDRDKELLFFSFDDGKRSSVKWKNVVWPDSPEVLRKKQEKALRAEREKMAILDRPAYKAPVKRLNTPTDYSVQQSYAVHGGYYGAPVPSGPTGAPAPYRSAPYAGPHNPQLQQAYGYPSNGYPSKHAPQQEYSRHEYSTSTPSGSAPPLPAQQRFATQGPPPQPQVACSPAPAPASMSAYYQQRQQEQQRERHAAAAAAVESTPGSVGGGEAVPPFLAARAAQVQAHQAPSFSGSQAYETYTGQRQQAVASDLLAAAAAAAAQNAPPPAPNAQA